MQKKPYCREGDFFLYGMSTIQEFEKLLQEEKSLFVIGFSFTATNPLNARLEGFLTPVYTTQTTLFAVNASLAKRSTPFLPSLAFAPFLVAHGKGVITSGRRCLSSSTRIPTSKLFSSSQPASRFGDVRRLGKHDWRSREWG